MTVHQMDGLKPYGDEQVLGDGPETASEAGPARPKPLADPLESGEKWLAGLVVVAVAALTALSFSMSFSTVSQSMVRVFGAKWAPATPLLLDSSVFAAICLLLLFARLGYKTGPVQVILWTLTATTVYLNWSAGKDTEGHIAHTVVSSIYIAFTTIGERALRYRKGLADPNSHDRIPLARWLLQPIQTARVYRGMKLWNQPSYPVALQIQRQRLRAIAEARVLFGWRWKRRLGPAVRLDLALGEVGPERIRKAHDDWKRKRDAVSRVHSPAAEVVQDVPAPIPSPRSEEPVDPAAAPQAAAEPAEASGRRRRPAAVDSNVDATAAGGKLPATDEALISQWLDELMDEGILTVRAGRERVKERGGSISNERLAYLVSLRKNPEDQPEAGDTFDGELRTISTVPA